MRDAKTAIQLSKVGLKREDRWILRDITWAVSAGSCAAILGPNGSGKSTLTRIIAGQLWPSCGELDVLSERFGQVDLHALRRALRLVQPAGPVEVDPDLTTHEVVMTGCFGTIGLYDQATAAMRARSLQVLDQVGLNSVAGHRYSTLSSGERMRCLIARALVVRPQLLLLDEPTAGLDLLAREQVLATVQSLFDGSSSSTTVLFITHHLEELPPATSNVLLLDNGAVAAAGSPKKVLTSRVLSPVYGCQMRVSTNGGRYYVQVHPGSWAGLLRRTAPRHTARRPGPNPTTQNRRHKKDFP